MGKIAVKKVIVLFLICLSILGTIAMINDSQFQIKDVKYHTFQHKN